MKRTVEPYPRPVTGNDIPPFPSIDSQICRQCAGMCCQGHPGLWIDPFRFVKLFFAGRDLTPALLQKELARLELELRQIGGVPVPAPRRSPEGCVFLADTGCLLDSDRRPCQCLALAPSVETLIDGEIRCRLPKEYGTGEARLRWERFWARQGRS